MLSLVRSYFREGVWVISGQVTSITGAIFGVRFLTELLSPVAYGELALGMTLSMLINQVMFGPLGQGATRYYAFANEVGSLHAFFGALHRMVWITVGVIFFSALLFGFVLVLLDMTQWLALGTAALAYSLLSGCDSLFTGINNAARRRSIVAIHQGLASWGRVLFAAGLIHWAGGTSTFAMAGYGIAMVFVLISQIFFFQPATNLSITSEIRENYSDRSYWNSKIFHYSAPFAMWGVFTSLYLSSDRWALKIYSSVQDVGYFAVLFQLGYYPVAIATGMAMQLLEPILFQRAGGDVTNVKRMKQAGKLNKKLTLIATGLMVFIFCITLKFHDDIFRLLAAREYASVSYLLPWVILGSGIFTVGQMVSLNFMSQMRPRAMIAPKISTALLGIGFNFLGVYYGGLPGIIVAGVAFSIVYFLWVTYIFMNSE